MDDFTPSPEFEKKLRTAVSAPSADTEFVRRLRAQVMAASAEASQEPTRKNHRFAPAALLKKAQSSSKRFSTWFSRLASGASHPTTNPAPSKGSETMRNRMLLPALVAVITLAVVAFFTLHPTSTVSAQQILDRASAAQTAAASAQGIGHTRIEIYQNFQPLGGENAGTKTVDSYTYPATGQYRVVTQDAAGKVTDAFAIDRSFTYSTKEAGNGALTIYRTPLTQDDLRKQQAADPATASQAGPGDPAASTKALFDQFNNNPRVALEGMEKRADGTQVYVLVDRNYHTQKALNGQDEKTYTGSVKMIFNAQNYQLVESQTTIRQDGKDILIDAARFLVDEVLQVETHIAWDLSDLKGATLVDEKAQPEQSAPQFGTLSEHELASRTRDGYVLKTLPAGFTLKIVAVDNQPKDQPYQFEVNYATEAGETFGLQAIGAMDPGFVETNFYDGSYKTANGMVLYYSISGSSAILALPDGNCFLLTSSLTRERVQTLVEDLVPAQ
jgi:hypothetical protein